MATDAPLIGVITPYFREPLAYLEECHASVKAQGAQVIHIMIADGHARPEIDQWDVVHIKLPRPTGDTGNTPRSVGGLVARSMECEFAAYLDADNWYHEGHLASLLELWREKKPQVMTSLRTFHELDRTPLDVFETDENALQHVDTSCLMLHREAFPSLTLWTEIPRPIKNLCDRVFLAGLVHQRYRIVSTGKRTVGYRTPYEGHYIMAGRPVPEGAKSKEIFVGTREYLTSAQGVSECVRQMGFWPPTYIPI